MDSTALSDLINQAAQNGNYILLGAAILALIVPLILKALGKNIPLIDPILNVLLAIAKSFKPKAKVDPNAPTGVAAVVPVTEAKTGVAAVVPVAEKKNDAP